VSARALPLVLAALLSLRCGGGPSALESQPQSITATAGSLIIPMEKVGIATQAPFDQNNGMWKAYGLVNRLLQNGIPVNWAIKPFSSPKSFNDIDFTVTTVTDKRTGTSIGPWDYRGGPFIINAADVPAANPIITAWWAANANQPNIHVVGSTTTANVDVVLRSAPRIANELTNANISIAYYNAAGIPDLNGNPWSTSSPNILNQTQIANGGLFSTGSCLKRQFDIFVTPHNSGYSGGSSQWPARAETVRSEVSVWPPCQGSRQRLLAGACPGPAAAVVDGSRLTVQHHVVRPLI
jgi:hypothetical protein